MNVIGQVQVLKSVCSWEIKNFDIYANRSNVAIWSPMFIASDCKWHMLLNTNNFSCDGKGQITIILRCLEDKEIEAEYCCTLISRENKLQHRSSKSVAYFSSQNFGHGKFFEKNIVMDTQTGKALANNTLVIVYEISIVGTMRENNCYGHHTEQLSKDLERLLNQQEFSDLTFITKDRRKIYVHKSILTCRSELFKVMIERIEERDEENAFVFVDDLDYDVLMEMFRFVYTGKLNKIVEFARQLYIASHRYGLNDLKIICEDAMCCDLKDDNVVDYVKFADKHGAKRLRMNSIILLKSNIKDIVKSPLFNTDLLTDLPSEIVVQMFQCLTKKI